MQRQDDYHVIIIGAGIGGLVCGCYLAKAGLKTLIIEQNAKPGGYCTSFMRKGFNFDACAHTIGKLIFTILDDLDLKEKINIKQSNPSNTIITSRYRINFWDDLNKTISEFQDVFPREINNIKLFFNFIIACQGTEYYPLVHTTFKDLLDQYFNDDELKAIFSLMLLKNIGLPASKISAFTAVTVYKDFILNGGYYIEESIQNLPDILMSRLKELGGDILLSKTVKKIKMNNGIAEGVLLDSGEFLSTKYIVSNIDARQTFLELVGKKFIDKKLLYKLNRMIPSLSSFIIYLGCDDKVTLPFAPYTTVFVSPELKVEEFYKLATKGKIESLDWYMFFISSDKRNLIISLNAAYKSKIYWLIKKQKLIDFFLAKIEKIIPDLSKHIIYKGAATPHTLYKWTSNYKGSAFGWESTPSQFATLGLSQVTPIKNLFLTGHWTTLTQGVSGVAYLGRSTAKIILDKEKNKL